MILNNAYSYSILIPISCIILCLFFFIVKFVIINQFKIHIMEIIIARIQQNETQTLGKLFVFDRLGNEVISCCTLELPWLGNRKKVSCIPAGMYSVKIRYSSKYGYHLHVQDVPDRTLILIHVGNYATQTEGCILVGASYNDVNGDGIMDITSSAATLNRLLRVVSEPMTLKIV